MRRVTSAFTENIFRMSVRRSTRSSTTLSTDDAIKLSPRMNTDPKSDKNISHINGTSKRKLKVESLLATPPQKKAKRTLLASSPDKAADLKAAVKESIALEDRPAEPHMTNAPLLTPHGSRIVPYAEAMANVSPSKSGIPRPITTTVQLLEQACAHLIEVDPKLEPLIKKHPCHVFSAEGLAEAVDPFKSLASGIMSQQVSGAAATSIKRKFIGLFDGGVEGKESEWSFPLPEVVAGAEVPFLRTAGLSERKAEYIKGLAEKFASGELTARWLIEASYDEMVEKLVAVRGLGRWSVEMFALFSLKRMDVFSLGDLGIQRGVAVIQGKDVKKLKTKGGKWKYATENEMEEFAKPFSPYRSLLMWYLWKASDTAVAAIQD